MAQLLEAGPPGSIPSTPLPRPEAALDGTRRLTMTRPLWLALALIAAAYEAVLILVPALQPFRLPIPYAVPIFDTPFALAAIGVGYLCFERHRLRQDFGSAALGASFWLGGLLAIAHILTQPDYPINPGVNAGVAPYFFLLSYLAAFVGIGLATHYGDRPFPLSDGARVGIAIGLVLVSLVTVVGVLAIRPVLPTLVMRPGRLTPFAIALTAVPNGLMGLWALAGARKKLLDAHQDLVTKFYLLAAFIWLLGLSGFLTFPFRYAVSWYLAGFARPIGILVVFVSLLREQVWLYAELRENLARFKETHAQLIQAGKLTALGTLVSGVAHELNNPLTTILMSAQLLQRQADLPAGTRNRVDTISQECERAARIIRDMLGFARRKESDRQRIELNDVIEATLARQARALELDNVRVVKELDSRVPPLWADPYQLQQVLLNIFTNAAQAMKSAHGRGLLTVRTLSRRGEAQVEISDDGPGIPEEYLSRVFDPFFTTKAPGEGTGLGLSLALGIITDHAGTMTAANLAGGGARFVITLPAAERVEPVGAPGGEIAPFPRDARILLVDDETNLRRALRDVLLDLRQRVDEAATGREAIAMLEREDYDLIALDLRLPDMPGSEVWRRIRERSADLASRVIFITGDTMSPQVQQFLEETRRPTLGKPFTIEGIRKALGSALAHTPA